MGGHDVPTDRIIKRYHRTLVLLPQAIATANRTVLFDNSSHNENAAESLRAFAQIENTTKGTTLKLTGEIPNWAADVIKSLLAGSTTI